MLGTYQHSTLRIEIDAAADDIRASLITPAQLRQWLWPQQFSGEFSELLKPGQTFASHLGPITIHHTVDSLTANSLRLLLHGGIDGFHEWYWGDGWVQSRLEGVSALPLNLAQTGSLLRLRLFLANRSDRDAA
jgi:hypothetical protein